MRRTLLTIVLALAATPAIAQTEDERARAQMPEPTVDEARAEIDACLAAAEAGRADASACSGVYSGPCIEARFSDTITIAKCSGVEADAWGAIVAEHYEELFVVSPEWRIPELRRAQELWGAWREAECAWARSEWEGGTGAGLLAVACRTRENMERALWLGPILERERERYAAAQRLDDQRN